MAFRGTREWASGHACKSRDQTRYDDLVAWLYVVVELMQESDTMLPLPWTHRRQKVAQMLKSAHAPARYLLHGCPQPFFVINSYLQTANRQKSPDYTFLADRIREAIEELRSTPDKP